MLVALLFAGCDGEAIKVNPSSSVGGTSNDENTASGPATGVGGGIGDGSGGAGGGGDGSGGAGGSSGSGQATAGAAGESGAAGDAGAAGEPGNVVEACQPNPEIPLDTCEYPESLGGAGDPARCGVTPAAWYPLGDSDFTTWPERAVWRSASGGGLGTTSSGPDEGPEVAFDSAGRAVVAWFDEAVQVARWDGSDWEALPSIVTARPYGAEIELALDQAGNPIVLVHDDILQVFRWRDEGWVLLDESLGGLPSAQLAVDAEDRPIVVYMHDCQRFEYRNRCHLVVKRWNGSAFELLPGSEEGGSLSAEADWKKLPALALRENGDIVVAWVDERSSDSEPDAVYLQQFNGERWEELGGSATGTGLARENPEDQPNHLTIAVDDADQVLVAWNSAIRVWDGTAWSPAEAEVLGQLVGGQAGSVYLTGTLSPSGSYPNGIWRWDAGEWTSLPAPPSDYGEIALAAGPDDHLGVAWFDYLAGFPNAVYFMENTDGEWREVGEATAHGEGLGPGYSPQLVSLEAGLFLRDGCHVDRWDGAAWQTLDLSEWIDAERCETSTLTESPTGQLVFAAWIAEATTDYDGNYPFSNLRILGWNGEGWEELTEPYRDEFEGAYGLQVAFDSTGTLVVSYASGDQGYRGPDVLAWDGTAWDRIGGGAWFEGYPPQLLVLPDDRVLMSWGDRNHLLTSIYGAGESKDPPDVELDFDWVAQREWFDRYPPRLGLDSSGTPFLAQPSEEGLALFELASGSWLPVRADDARLSTLPEQMRLHVFSDVGEVYLRRFENCGWRGISASDRGGGVSNSQAPSEDLWLHPSVALHNGSTCVAWTERGERDSAQLVRCHD